MGDAAAMSRVADAVAALARMASGDGDSVLRRCVALLAEVYRADFVSVSLVDGTAPTLLCSRVNFADGVPGAAFEYDQADAPCGTVLSDGRLAVAEQASDRYPDCWWMQQLALDAYIGVPIVDDGGHTIGVLLVASRSRLDEPAALRPLLPLFADRVAAEVAAVEPLFDHRLAENAFDYNLQAIMITDDLHRIVKVNPSFSRITGWSVEEVIGRRHNMLSAGRDEPGLHEEIQATLDRHGSWVGELWSRRSDGEVFPEQRTVVTLPDGPDGHRRFMSLFSDISAEKFASERIHRLAHYDATTELPNRVLLQDRLLHAINQVARTGGRLALLFLDLDGFKLVNDTLGHRAGDEVLRQVGARLTSRLRKADVVARIGGDEFAVVLSEFGQDSDVQTICDQLLAVVTEPYELDGRKGHVTTSIGIALFPEDGTDVQTLLKHADAAMYQAKSNGKNRYAFYEPETNRRAEQRLILSRQLRNALERDEFSLCYQPQYDLASGRLMGVEALVRWRDDSGEMVTPTRFIPMAEDTGLIMALGAWVLEHACAQAQEWCQQGLEFGRLAVNISGRQFQGEQLQQTVERVLAETGLSAELLELEITESWVMEGLFKAEKQMEALRDMGVSLVIDDFGVANSSMAYLKRFPVQKLKIDQSFIRDIPDDPEDAAIVSAIIAMGHSLGLRVVAEGVERSEQAAYLRGTGCDEVQGYLYGRPVPSDEMNVLILYNPTLSSA